ncbi:hypothetical protein D918_00207 [Trichuris suis]|nr:hypothetical protein D918_00207 [Trichuris suis]
MQAAYSFLSGQCVVMPPGGGATAAQLLHKGQVVDDRWVVEKMLGKGGFGAVFEVTDKKTGRRDAMKIEINATDFRTLKVEVTVLKTLNENNARHVCQITGVGKKELFCFIVMTLVGPSINSLLESLQDQFSDGRTRFVLRSCIYVGQRSLEALEDLHANGFLHRDVKPHNYASGRPPHYRKIYLLDFGMCRKYVKEDGSLRRPRERVGFRGTLFYASVDCLRGKEQARRDDVWSWFFMLIRMTVGQLPWRGWAPPRGCSVTKQASMFGEFKGRLIRNVRRFVDGCPSEYAEIAELLQNQDFYDTPPYARIYSVLNSLMARKGYDESYPLDWEDNGKHHQQTMAAPAHNMMPGGHGQSSLDYD